MISNKQRQANQNNAKLGGVKTDKGKAVSKYNAITHGILTNSITDYEQEFYSNILEDLKAEYMPLGLIEEILIERIAIHYLKLYRVQKAETEYIKAQLHPRKVIMEGGLELDKSLLIGKEVVIDEGYNPLLTEENTQKLSETYSRYEGAIENRLFRALHELERVQRIRKGEIIAAPYTADINQMGSFGNTK